MPKENPMADEARIMTRMVLKLKARLYRGPGTLDFGTKSPHFPLC